MNQFQSQIQKIEAEIIAITGTDYAKYNEWTENGEQRNRVESLFKLRRELLNDTFQLTPKNLERFRKINSQLLNLTKQCYERISDVDYFVDNYMIEYENEDREFESRLRFVFNGEDSVLKLEDDEYYGSNFTLMIKALAELYQSKGQENIIYTRDGIDRLDDGQSWMDTPFNQWEAALKDIVICYAVHDLTNHKAYSIPDLLRLNDFWTEARITFQSITRQDSTRVNHNGIR